MGKLTDEAQEKKIAELKGTKLKVNIHGKLISEDSDGNVLNAPLIYKDKEIIITEEFIKFITHKYKIKSIIKEYLKKDVEEKIMPREDFYTYMIIDPSSGIVLLSLTFKYIKRWVRTDLLEINAIITQEKFQSTQVHSIIAVLNGMIAYLNENDEALKKANCKAHLEKNI